MYLLWGVGGALVLVALVVGVLWGLGVFKTAKTEQVAPIVLTEQQRKDLIQSMSADPNATSSLSEQQEAELIRSSSAAEGAAPTLSDEERHKLIEAMSGR